MKNSKLTTFIFLALAAGILFGWLAPSWAVKMQPLADVFLKMVKMIIAPLIFATLVVGIAGHGDVKNLGKIGLKTIIYFEIATTFALIIGLLSANILQPGAGFDIDLNTISMSAVENMENVKIDHSFSHMLLDLVPTSIFKALAEGSLLQIVVFAIFFSLAICAVGQKARPVLDFMQSTCDVMFKFTEYVMYFAPMGVFGAISATIGQNGIGILSSYAKLIGVTYLSLIIFVATILTIVCKIIKVPFFALLRAIKEPSLLAFSTASSEAALPKAMEAMEKFDPEEQVFVHVQSQRQADGSAVEVIFRGQTLTFLAEGTHLLELIAVQVRKLFFLAQSQRTLTAVARNKALASCKGIDGQVAVVGTALADHRLGLVDEVFQLIHLENRALFFLLACLIDASAVDGSTVGAHQTGDIRSGDIVSDLLLKAAQYGVV